MIDDVGSLKTVNLLLRELRNNQSVQDLKNPALSVTLPDCLMIELDTSSHPVIHHIRTKNKQLSQSKLKPRDLEQVLVQWLNMNFKKQKSGTFIPLCTMKWTVQSSSVNFMENISSSTQVQIEFFVASAMHSINTLCDIWRKTSLDSNIERKSLKIML